MSDQPNMFAPGTGLNGWLPAIAGAGFGYIAGNGGLNNGNKTAAESGVTSDQVDAKLAAMEGRQGRDALAATIAALGVQVNTNQQVTSAKLCEIDMRVVTTAAATDNKISQLEIGMLARASAEKDLRIAELQSAGHHRDTQNIIVNAQASASASGGAGCNAQLLQALQVAAALRANQCPAGTGSGN